MSNDDKGIPRELVDEIRRTIDPRQYLKPAKKKGTYICEWCGNGTGKDGDGLVYYDDTNKLFCFSPKCEGKPVDVIDVYMKVHGVTFREAVEALRPGSTVEHKRIPSSLQAKQAAPKVELDFTEYYAECRPRLHRAEKYLASRGISRRIAETFGVGFDPVADTAGAGYFAPRLIMPISKSCYVARRTDGGEVAKKIYPKGAHRGIANLQELDTAGNVYIVEGYMDMLSIYEVGGRAVSLNSASNAKDFVAYVKEHRPKAFILLTLDTDNGGQGGQDIIKAGLEAEKIPYRVVNLCGDSKDPNEALVKDREQFARKVQEGMNTPEVKQENPFSGFLARISGGRYKAKSTGIKEIDEVLGGGIIPGSIVLIGAEPGAGKSAVCQQLAESMTMQEDGFVCQYICLEMTGDILLARSLSRVLYENNIADLSAFDVLQGRNIQAIEQGLNIFLPTGQRVQYNPGSSAGGELPSNRLADIIKTIEGAERVDLVVLDYVQLVDAGAQTEIDNIKRTMQELIRVSREKNVIVIGVMAHSRAAKKTDESDMGKGRGSSNLEFGADYILNLSEDEVTHKQVMTVAKARLAMRKRKMYYTLDGRHMRITGMDVPMGIEESRKEQKVSNDISNLPVNNKA